MSRGGRYSRRTHIVSSGRTLRLPSASGRRSLCRNAVVSSILVPNSLSLVAVARGDVIGVTVGEMTFARCNAFNGIREFGIRCRFRANESDKKGNNIAFSLRENRFCKGINAVVFLPSRRNKKTARSLWLVENRKRRVV